MSSSLWQLSSQAMLWVEKQTMKASALSVTARHIKRLIYASPSFTENARSCRDPRAPV